VQTAGTPWSWEKPQEEAAKKETRDRLERSKIGVLQRRK
jgi:hypothetical protein